MSARLNVSSVRHVQNPMKMEDPFQIEIAFEVFEDLKEGVEWELVFVRNEGKTEGDQTLDCVETGPINAGRHKFTLESPAPEVSSLSVDDLTDVTLLLLRCKYKDQLFISVGWYVTHVYDDPQLLENPPEKPQVEKMSRHIVTGDVRVTTYSIKWGEDIERPPENGEPEPEPSENEEESEDDEEDEDESGEEMEQTEAPDALKKASEGEKKSKSEEGASIAEKVNVSIAEEAVENSSGAVQEPVEKVEAPAITEEPMPLADTTNS